jgi:hypothetical protein
VRIPSVVRLIVPVLAACVSCFAQSVSWTQKTPAASPSPRGGHAMAYDSVHSQTVMFGGITGASGFLGDTWVWDGSAWTQKSPTANPPARCCHAMGYDSVRGQIVLFGGNNGSMFFNDTWIWDGTNWAQVFPASNPPARAIKVGAYDAARQQFVIFGGIAAGGGVLADTWVWDGSNWAQKFPLTSPSARGNHTLAYDAARQHVVLFGGSPGSGVALADTWTWDGSNWTQQSPSASPSGRYDSKTEYDAAQQAVVLFGGVGPPIVNGSATTYLADTWLWNGTTWQSGPSAGPPARAVHSMAYDSAHGQVVLFGGGTSTTFGDTWVLGPPQCSPPKTISIDDSGAAGLISASASAVGINNNGELTANVTIHNPLRFWLGLLDESSSAGATTQPSPPPSYLTPCASQPFIFGCPDPGGAVFKTQFCSPGAITLAYGETPLSAGATYVDAIAPVSLDTVASLVMSLQAVPDWVALQSCLTNLGLGTPACLGTGVLNLVRDHQQLDAVLAIFRQAGINITKGVIISELTLFLANGETLEDLLQFVIQTRNAGHLDTVSIKIVGN